MIQPKYTNQTYDFDFRLIIYYYDHMLKKGTISRVGIYYIKTPEYKDDIVRAMKAFFKGLSGSEEPGNNLFRDIKEEGYFNEWLLYDFKFKDGKGMLEKYYYENPESIPEYRRSIYKDLMENYFGLYEILEIRPFTGLKLRRLEDSKEFDVYEMSLTTQVNIGDLFFTRVARVEDRYELVGCDTELFGLSALPEKQKLEQVKEFAKLKNLTPIDALRMIRRY